MSDDKKENELYTQNCPTCGIVFGIPAKMETIWRNNHSTFHCPNGHNLSWSGETPKDKEHKLRGEELEKLKAELAKTKTDLEAKLAKAKEELAVQKKKADELQAELEIWRPSTTEEKKTG